MKGNIIDAINLTLKEEMSRDKKVLVLGEDVGVDGGVFRATDGLIKKFGEDRVIDVPLAESAIVGTSIGMSVTGMKPVAEIQFSGFIYPAFNQIVSHAARMRNRTRGRYSCPMVIRAPYSGGIRALEHHSESMEALYAHVPGLKVVIPSSPSEAKGLLASCIRDPDPVIFLEPKRIYRAIREDIPKGEYLIPIGKARIVRSGNRLTLVAWGAMVRECETAIGDEDIELIDLRTISPIDEKTLIESVKKTGRCIIVHEGPRTCGVGAELSARIMEKAVLYLDAPVKRITGYDTIIPLYKLEMNYLPTPEKIKKAITEVLEYEF
jgi:pyruvate dehydrogenase E1 component beta subunit